MRDILPHFVYHEVKESADPLVLGFSMGDGQDLAHRCQATDSRSNSAVIRLLPPGPSVVFNVRQQNGVCRPYGPPLPPALSQPIHS